MVVILTVDGKGESCRLPVKAQSPQWRKPSGWALKVWAGCRGRERKKRGIRVGQAWWAASERVGLWLLSVWVQEGGTGAPAPWSTASQLALYWLVVFSTRTAKTTAFWDIFLFRIAACTTPRRSFLPSLFITYLTPYLPVLFTSPSLFLESSRISGAWFAPVNSVGFRDCGPEAV